jgi:hypothetical protein
VCVSGVQVGDGDCGDTMARAAAAIQSAVSSSYPLNSPSSTAAALAGTVGRAVGGTSGALYGVLLTAGVCCKGLLVAPVQACSVLCTAHAGGLPCTSEETQVGAGGFLVVGTVYVVSL